MRISTTSLPTQRRVAPVRLNPFTPEFLALKNPYPLLHELREFGPVSWIEGAQLWAVTSYKAAGDVLFNRRLRTFLNSDGTFDFENASAFNRALRWAIVLSAHADRHTRLRSLFAGLMNPNNISQLRPASERTAHRLIDRIESQGKIDIVKDYGFALPFEQISDLLCMPEEIRAQAMHWMQVIFAGVRDITYGVNDEAVLQAANGATIELNACFASLIAERRLDPRDDMLDRMIRVAEKNGVSDEELCVNAWTLYIGGYETTGTTIGTGILRLFQNPETLDRVRNNTELIPFAVEESLRYDVPSFITARICDEDLVVGDQLVQAGERIAVILGAANRDPEQFPDPDRFDITRKSRALSFGIGPHMCAGQLLARMNIETAFSILLKRLPRLKLDDLDPPRTPAISGGLPSLMGSWQGGACR